MKSITKILALLVLVFVFTNSYAQKKAKTWSGYVKYEITYEGDMDPQTRAMSPNEMTQYFMDSKVRMEILTPMANQYIITDGNDSLTIILIDGMGQKLAIKSEKEDNAEAMKDVTKSKVDFLNETKEIAGITCTKVEVTFPATEDSDKQIVTAYYAEGLNVGNINWSGQFSEVPGILMEYSMENQGFTMNYKAVEVKKQKLKATMFQVPADYRLLTKEEAQQMFGGM
ncbi:MAG: hypothetical protein JXR58_11900 [Bacteroidales bacterium]|nr:hypothetical protein [Bacteroidales bacterium]